MCPLPSRTRAASAAGGVRVATGIYTGDGAATQAIVGVGFQPRFLIIFKMESVLGNVIAMFMKSTVDGLNAKMYSVPWTTWWYVPDFIISLDADGFTVGDGAAHPFGNQTNILDTNYTYIAYG